MAEIKDELRDHSYDGIQEYDNPLPSWWSWLFIGTVVFSPLYWMYFHNGLESRSIYSGYEQSVANNLRVQFSEIGDLKPDRNTMAIYMKEEKWLAVGENVFNGNCVSCHGANAEGKTGPNLTDDNWKNVTKLEDIPRVVANGAANNAMPAWGNKLHVNEVVLVSAYIANLRGNEYSTTGKREGNKIPPWDTRIEKVDNSDKKSTDEKPADKKQDDKKEPVKNESEKK